MLDIILYIVMSIRCYNTPVVLLGIGTNSKGNGCSCNMYTHVNQEDSLFTTSFRRNPTSMDMKKTKKQSVLDHV